MTKLYVICGHGAGDSGACGNGYQEAERVRALGKRINEIGGDNVMLGDVNRNYYADNGISNLGISKDYQIIELHMDSSKSATARGAHVIIRAGLDADQYDKALAKYLSTLLPGRSQTIVGRDDLANPDRAYVAGYSYRLVEIGFISNAQDVTIFNANIDTIAKGILDCFGIGANGNVTPSPKPQPTPAPSKKPVDQIAQEVINGAWGNGDARKTQLTQAGYDYNAVQAKVNQLLGAETPSKPVPKPQPTFNIKVGDWVGVRTGAKDYNGNNAGGVVRGKVYYTVDELKGDRAVLDMPGICTPFHVKDLFK